nr:MAG TPA: hypothetical protein [Caudoviricetes sp.]
MDKPSSYVNSFRKHRRRIILMALHHLAHLPQC